MVSANPHGTSGLGGYFKGTAGSVMWRSAAFPVAADATQPSPAPHRTARGIMRPTADLSHPSGPIERVIPRVRIGVRIAEVSIHEGGSSLDHEAAEQGEGLAEVPNARPAAH